MLLGFLGQDYLREDGVEGQVLVTKDDPDHVEPLVEAVEELGGEIHLGDGAVDVGEEAVESPEPCRQWRRCRPQNPRATGKAVGELLREDEGGRVA